MRANDFLVRGNVLAPEKYCSRVCSVVECTIDGARACGRCGRCDCNLPHSGLLSFKLDWWSCCHFIWLLGKLCHLQCSFVLACIGRQLRLGFQLLVHCGIRVGGCISPRSPRASGDVGQQYTQSHGLKQWWPIPAFLLQRRQQQVAKYISLRYDMSVIVPKVTIER